MWRAGLVIVLLLVIVGLSPESAGAVISGFIVGLICGLLMRGESR